MVNGDMVERGASAVLEPCGLSGSGDSLIHFNRHSSDGVPLCFRSASKLNLDLKKTGAI